MPMDSFFYKTTFGKTASGVGSVAMIYGCKMRFSLHVRRWEVAHSTLSYFIPARQVKLEYYCRLAAMYKDYIPGGHEYYRRWHQ